jgi:hypothetical protein
MTGIDLVIHPGTGEVLEQLDEQPAETLADALVVLRERAAQFKAADQAIDAELRRRLRIRGRKHAIFGDVEAEVQTGRESEWDGKQLDATLADLVAEGVVQASEVADVVEHPAVVARSKAKSLLGRLTGDARARVEEACTWKDKPARLKVVRSAQLTPAEPDSALPALPAGDGAGRDDHPASPAPAFHAPAKEEVPAGSVSPTEPRAPLDPEDLFAW